MCFAVGESSLTGSQASTLVERWNGKAWTIVASPNPPATKFARLYSVSCTSATSCFAVGSQIKTGVTPNIPLVERWNGTKWSIVTTPAATTSPHNQPFLLGVSCTSASFCVAAGYVFLGDSSGQFVGSNPLVEQCNGTKWSLGRDSRHRPASTASRLDAVSCTSPTACFAVGNQNLKVRPPGSFADGPVSLTERWDGKHWTVVPTASPTIGSGATLLSVSCTAKTNCLAAGEYLEGDVGRPGLLTERWDGKHWTLLASHTPSRAYTWLNGISCTGTTSCMTVGYSSGSTSNGGGALTLTERWNGMSWSIAPSAAAGVASGILGSVSCAQATSCMAVGQSSGTQGGSNTLVLRWDGTKWTKVPSPNPAA